MCYVTRLVSECNNCTFDFEFYSECFAILTYKIWSWSLRFLRQELCWFLPWLSIITNFAWAGIQVSELCDRFEIEPFWRIELLDFNPLLNVRFIAEHKVRFKELEIFVGHGLGASMRAELGNVSFWKESRNTKYNLLW